MWPSSTKPARIDLLVLQASSFCNIDCRYCYLRERDNNARMSPDVLAAVASNLVPSRFAPDVLSICWHAGEPLAVPLRWYQKAFDELLAAARPGQRLRHHFQTNATLIDSTWIDFFERHAVALGVSIDGPRALHDANRVTRRGHGTFERSLRGVEQLRAAGLAFDVIAVLTRESLLDPDGLFDFFVGLGPRSLGFNIDEIEGPHRDSSLGTADARAALRGFLDRFFARHAEAAEPFALRPLVQLHQAASGRALGHHRRGNDQIEPLSILTVAADGGLSTYSPELIGTPAPEFGDFIFGNVREGGPEQLFANPRFRRLRARVETGRRRCARSCGYFGICGGGAPGNKFFETGRFETTETLYCRLSIQEMAEAALAHLETRRAVGATTGR